MDYQYKVIVSNRHVYKEFEIPADMERVRLGTTSSCEFRLSPDAFFDSIEMDFEKKNSQWEIASSDTAYISRGDMRKLLSTELKHGDILSVRYTASGNEAFEIRFMIDFEAKVPDYNWFVDITNHVSLVIGDDTTSDLIIEKYFDVENKARLYRENGFLYLEEVASKYGINLNGRRIQGKEKVEDYDFVSIGSVSFFYKQNRLYFDKKNIVKAELPIEAVEKRINSFKYPLFNRNTRTIEKISDEKITILDPPAEIKEPENNLLSSLVPAIVTLVITIVIRSSMNSAGSSMVILSACTMGMGICTSIYSYFNGKKKYKAECEKRVSDYSNYITNKRAEISSIRQEELTIANNTYYDINREVGIVDNFSSELFDRTDKDKDFLCAYLGRGTQKANRVIDWKTKEQLETKDEISLIPEQIYNEFEYINNSPISISLKNANVIGVVGDKSNTETLCRNMIMDLAVRHYYGDVRFVALLDEENEKWNWIRHIPHFLSESNRRNIVFNTESRNNIFEYLYQLLSTRQGMKKFEGIHYVVFVLNEHGIKNHPLSKFMECAEKLGVVFIFFEEREEDIPLNCSNIIKLKSDTVGHLYKSDNAAEVTEFIYEKVDDVTIRRIARRLFPVYCEEISLESSLRKTISFFELLQIYAASDLDLGARWAQSRIYESMASPLGVNSKDEIVYLNLHEKAHGPHGLVAGTTGSGKSEILQSYILSAATLFHPYEIGFVIIDFKGGGMVNQFKKLPHLIGAITNIDGKEIDRSLKSIKAELMKRQSLFAEANVNHIDKYIKLYKEGKVQIPLPHLVIIVDEFAELKAEQPEFMKELISAARIGRSLGIHLILATQKPAGQVNEQIWSNSKFKMCLKVQNEEDSKEVLKSPLAAEIREPGRAYLQVGNNEIFELFQSAYSGGPAVVSDSSNQKKFIVYEKDFGGKLRPVFEKKIEKTVKASETELDAIVNYIADYCDKESIDRLPSICLPSLQDSIDYEKDTSRNGDVALGVYDDPDSQYQGAAVMNFARENTFVIGTSQIGKTNLLQLIIRSLADNNTPENVNIYILDFGTMILKNFEKLKHVGGVVIASEDEKLKNLFKLLNSEMDVRKQKLLQTGVSSYQAYCEAGGKDIPQIYVMLDNFNAFKELYMDTYEAQFMKLCRDGISLGISLIVTNSTSNGFGYKYMSNFLNRVCFTCGDKGEYSNLFDRCRMEPKNVPGRVLLSMNKMIYEAQTYLAFSGEKEIDRAQKVREYIERTNERYEEYRSAKLIPAIPEKLDRNLFNKEYHALLTQAAVPMGLDFATIDPAVIDINEEYELALVGKNKEIVNGFLKTFVRSIHQYTEKASCEYYVIDNFVRTLKYFNDMPATARYTIDVAESEMILTAIHEKLRMRKDMLIAGMDIKSESQIVLIINSKDVMEYISQTKPVMAIFNEIIKNYKNYGIFIIYSDIENATVPYGAPELLKRVKDNKKAILFDNLNVTKIFEIPTNIIRAYNKPLMHDEAYWLNGTDVNKIKLLLEEG